MISDQQFDAEMKKIILEFGQTNYSDARVESIHDWISGSRLDYFAFSSVVKELLANQPKNKPPVLDDFKKAFEKTKARKSLRPFAGSGPTQCSHCDGYGTVFAYLRATTALYSFGCNLCFAGNRNAWPKWDNSLIDLYVPDYMRSERDELLESVRVKPKRSEQSRSVLGTTYSSFLKEMPK